MILPDTFVTGMPTNQKIADLFTHQWLSNLPLGDVVSGDAQLFFDDRIDWFLNEINGVEGKSVLELGPLEGGHSWMIEKAGAASILAIEANARSFLKCLVAKELTGLRRTRYRLGDFIEFLKQTDEEFDVCIACGVLYHLVSPLEFLHLVSEHCSSIMIWTHYYDEKAIKRKSIIDPAKFSAHAEATYNGFPYTLHRYEYLDALALESFCGGTVPFSHWVNKEDILGGLEFFGFKNIKIKEDIVDHQHGPCLTLCASKD
jgi:hypothetical protein